MKIKTRGKTIKKRKRLKIVKIIVRREEGRENVEKRGKFNVREEGKGTTKLYERKEKENENE